MTSVMKRALCNLLIVLMAWTPIQMAYAGVISTDQAVGASSQADGDGASVQSFGSSGCETRSITTAEARISTASSPSSMSIE